MSRSPFGVAWRLLVIGCAVALAGSAISVAASNPSEGAWPLSWLGFLLVGAVLVTRLPRNRIGWCMLVIGGGLTTVVIGELLSLPPAVSLLSVPLLGAGFIAIELFLLWYPTGAVVSSGWLWVQRAIVVLGTVGVGYFLVRPGPVSTDQPGDNPLGIEFLGGLRDSPVELVVVFLFAGLGVTAFASLWVRWRRAAIVERQQLKWILAAGLWFLFSYVVLLFFSDESSALNDLVFIATFVVGFNAMAVGVGIAIFKYRLYDIDRIINRTVVYALVVGVLGLVFVAGAVWLPSLLPFEENSVAVAGSTLVVLLLFNPLRARIQRFVDRRFYRSRYDAQEVADEFSARLRDQVEPEAVTAEWVEVVQRTMQPTTVAVWVSEDA